MGNLEHNIKEAFAAQDSKTKLANKDALWNRLENKMHSKKGVAAFWRVAAIILGFMIFTGAFATLNKRAKHQNQLEKMELENTKMSATIDSLLSLPLKTQTEIQIVEKEKIVYRDKLINQQNTNSENTWEKKYQVLSDSTEILLATQERFYSAEIKQLENELNESRNKMDAFKQSTADDTKSEQTAPFELKSERIDVGVQKKPAVKTPEVKMKVLQKNFIENRNNLNKNIFKK